VFQHVDIENFFLFRAQAARDQLEAIEGQLNSQFISEVYDITGHDKKHPGTECCKQIWQLNQLPISLINLQEQEMEVQAAYKGRGTVSMHSLECKKVELERTYCVVSSTPIVACHLTTCSVGIDKSPLRYPFQEARNMKSAETDTNTSQQNGSVALPNANDESPACMSYLTVSFLNTYLLALAACLISLVLWLIVSIRQLRNL
jgi:hypothetical protein